MAVDEQIVRRRIERFRRMGMSGEEDALLFSRRSFGFRRGWIFLAEPEVTEGFLHGFPVEDDRFRFVFEVADAVASGTIQRILRKPCCENGGAVLIQHFGIHTADFCVTDDFRKEQVVVIILCHTD